ncbi:hypothetical protein LPJGGPFB_01595 [Ensifer adhaerens]|uniref:response regulator n=1 Tax=Ensifer adhaerens TaxID=106592 RepID=UPI003D079BF9|nr:hypothetical protein [Ensifer adhaerens]
MLLVEDEFLIAMDLKLLLERQGWIVIGPAATVDEALALLDEQLPSVAIFDATLKDNTVTPVAEALRVINVLFVIASAYGAPAEVGGCVLAQAPDVGKPTVERDLFNALEHVVSS